jgi:hypothetical protein
LTPTDRFVETSGANGSFGALNPNSGSWSSSASGDIEVLSRNLTFKVSSNQVAVQLSAVTVSNVPKPASLILVTGRSIQRMEISKLTFAVDVEFPRIVRLV